MSKAMTSAEFAAGKKQERWKPKDEALYHWAQLDSCGEVMVHYDIWSGIAPDLARYLVGNVHRTEAAALRWIRPVVDAFKQIKPKR